MVYVKQLAVPGGTGSNVAAEQCGRGDQMGFTPDEARCPGLDMARPSVVPFAAQASPLS